MCNIRKYTQRNWQPWLVSGKWSDCELKEAISLTMDHSRLYRVHSSWKRTLKTVIHICHLDIPHNCDNISCNTINLWKFDFRSTASTVKNKLPVTGQTPPNIARFREALIVLSCWCEVFNEKHTVVRCLYPSRVRAILHKNLNFHLYEMVMMLSGRGKVKRAIFLENFLKSFTNEIILFLICHEFLFIF